MGYGLFRQKNTRGDYAGAWYTRLTIPPDVRPHFDGKTAFVASTGTRDKEAALLRARELWGDWKPLIREARALGGKGAATLDQLRHALDIWRQKEVERAAGVREPTNPIALEMVPGMAEIMGRMSGPFRVDLSTTRGPRAGIPINSKAWARDYFDKHPQASQSFDLPYAIGKRLDAFRAAAVDPAGWVQLPGFDDELDAAAREGGLAGVITTEVRAKGRHSFAKAAYDVEGHREAERRRAVAILAHDGASAASVQSPKPYVATVDDRTVAQAVEAFKADRSRNSVEDIDKRYGHLFRAICEIVGEDRIIRTVTDVDAVAVYDLLRKIPANASKLYPGRTLADAAELAHAEMGVNDRRRAEGQIVKRNVKLLARNTHRSYIVNGSAVWGFALRKRWVDANLFQPLIGKKRDEVKRRSFKVDELTAVFEIMAAQRETREDYFWAISVLSYSGARMNEIAQLRPGDVKENDDAVPYIDLTEFNEHSVREETKRLKNGHSFRAVPIHPELVAAGFLEFVGRRREEGARQLFPACRLHEASGLHSHELSKWFGRQRHKAGVDGRATPAHSFRHGFREGGRKVGLSDEIIDALGGWASASEGADYGDRNSPDVVSDNAVHMAKVRLGDFSLSEFLKGLAPAT